MKFRKTIALLGSIGMVIAAQGATSGAGTKPSAAAMLSHTTHSCMDRVTGEEAKKWRNAIIVAAPPIRCFKRSNQKGDMLVKPSILVIHYTAASLGQTLFIFTGYYDKVPLQRPPVTSHYTISEDGYTIQHAAESMAARHAGISAWRDLIDLNEYSIGIELVNEGYKEDPEQPAGVRVAGDQHEWYPFEEKQLNAALTLCKKIIADHGIEERNVVGHGDIAPGRKVDPGPLFPWEKFAAAGVGAWPDMSRPIELPCYAVAQGNNELESWVQKHLPLWGYKKADANTRQEDIIRAFQMHFRQNNISGTVDQETAEILAALLQTYKISTPSECPCHKAP